MSKHEYKVGDAVLYIPIGKRFGKQAALITKIGRKWVYLNVGGYRFNKATGHVDGGEYSSPGRVYPSKAAYMEDIEREALWAKIRSHVVGLYNCPDGVDTMSLLAICETLGISTEVDK